MTGQPKPPTSPIPKERISSIVVALRKRAEYWRAKGNARYQGYLVAAHMLEEVLSRPN